MKTLALVTAIALSSLLVGCGERNNPPIKTSKSGGEQVVQPTASAPPAPADRATPPDPTPVTHAGAPTPTPSAPTAPTARDTGAQRPASEMTKAEEQSSQPKPGQGDSHSTPSIQEQIKGTQQSPGTAAATAESPAPKN